jgi:hypothetical protein
MQNERSAIPPQPRSAKLWRTRRHLLGDDFSERVLKAVGVVRQRWTVLGLHLQRRHLRRVLAHDRVHALQTDRHSEGHKLFEYTC